MIDWMRRNPLSQEIELGGETLPIVLRRMKQARRLTLRLAPDGSEVRITLPSWARDTEALAFAHARTDWLAQQLAKIPRRTSPRAGSTLLFRGQGLTINWQYEMPRRPKLVDTQVQVGGPEQSLEKRLKGWLERTALRLFESDMRDYVARANLAPVPVALSRAQKRWGSCSDKERIRLNWRLVQAPDFVRRSVVAHEVTHLVHFDHSPAFHALLDQIYEDDIKQADGWLKENGRSLYSAFG